LLDDGYPAVLVQNEKLIFRIVVASFQSKEEADKKLDLLKKTFSEAWILTKK